MDDSSSTIPAAGIVSLILARPSWPLLAGRIIGNNDITAGCILVEFALRDQVIQDILGLFILLHLLLHLIHLRLHLVELQHLRDDAVILDLLLELLLLDLALGSSSLGADLEHVDGGAVDLYANEEENELG